MINSTVAIIIVNWKKYDITSTCIESILNSTNSNFKIILVDNESDNENDSNETDSKQSYNTGTLDMFVRKK